MKLEKQSLMLSYGTRRFHVLYNFLYVEKFHNKTSFSIIKVYSQSLSPVPACWLNKGRGTSRE
jgi:hypothetical protein